jgi:hypothetical protein
MSTELLYDKISELLQKTEIVNRHSFFQIKYFIVLKEPTHQARLWRCIQEMEVRKESIKALRMEIEDSKDNLRLIEIEMAKSEVNSPSDPLDKEERAIQIKKRQRRQIVAQDRLLGLQKKLKEVEEETNLFYEIYKALEKQEPLKPYDDFESQLQMWNEKISQEFDLRGLLGLPVDLELARTTLALENGTPIKQKFIQKLQQIRAEAELQQIRADAKYIPLSHKVE